VALNVPNGLRLAVMGLGNVHALRLVVEGLANVRAWKASAAIGASRRATIAMAVKDVVLKKVKVGIFDAGLMRLRCDLELCANRNRLPTSHECQTRVKCVDTLISAVSYVLEM
jgi:hypothetical protein